MYDYMADCIPFMQKLDTDTTEKHTINTIFATSSKKGVQRKEIFHEYLRKVEDYKGCIEDEKVAAFEDVSKCIACGSSNILSVTLTSEEICEDCGCEGRELCSLLESNDVTLADAPPSFSAATCPTRMNKNSKRWSPTRTSATTTSTSGSFSFRRKKRQAFHTKSSINFGLNSRNRRSRMSRKLHTRKFEHCSRSSGSTSASRQVVVTNRGN